MSVISRYRHHHKYNFISIHIHKLVYEMWTATDFKACVRNCIKSKSNCVNYLQAKSVAQKRWW